MLPHILSGCDVSYDDHSSWLEDISPVDLISEDTPGTFTNGLSYQVFMNSLNYQVLTL